MLIVSEKADWVQSLNLYDADVSTLHTMQGEIAAFATGQDLVVVDTSDPEAALDICHCLRPHLNGALVLYTDVTDETYQRRAYSAGVNECVPKPIAESLLEAKLAAWRRRIKMDRHIHLQ